MAILLPNLIRRNVKAESPTGDSTANVFILLVEQPGIEDQEEYDLYPGLSIGRLASNKIRIDGGGVEPIHAQLLRNKDRFFLKCVTPDARIELPNSELVTSLPVTAGTCFTIAGTRFRCVEKIVPQVMRPAAAWRERCPRCHEPIAGLAPEIASSARKELSSLSTSAERRKCRSCQLDLFYHHALTGNEGEFSGWLPAVVGSYRIERFVGQGGVGIVLLGKRDENGELAAIKIPIDEELNDACNWEDVIKILRGHNHPNIVLLLDNNKEGYLRWLAMEWVDGTLETRLRACEACNQRISDEEIAQHLIGICDGLEYLHFYNIIHCNLKPSNIRLSTTGDVKLADFGVNGILNQGQADRTATGTAADVGTQAYMSPEQSAERMLTPASDVYAVGVVWHEMVYGSKPTGFLELKKRLPRAHRRVMMRCLAADPSARPALAKIRSVVISALQRTPSAGAVRRTSSPSDSRKQSLTAHSAVGLGASSFLLQKLATRLGTGGALHAWCSSHLSSPWAGTLEAVCGVSAMGLFALLGGYWGFWSSGLMRMRRWPGWIAWPGRIVIGFGVLGVGWGFCSGFFGIGPFAAVALCFWIAAAVLGMLAGAASP